MASSSYVRRSRSLSLSGGGSGDNFDIPAKGATPDRLRQWRKAALVLNASRRFRYTSDLKKEERQAELRKHIRGQAQVVRAALLFRDAGLGQRPKGDETENDALGFQIGQEELSALSRDQNKANLHHHGEVAGIASKLHTSIENGISVDDAEIQQRRDAFGSNTYPQKKGKNFWVFLWDACKDMTLIILMIAAVASLVLGIQTEGIKEGWYDGASISFAVILVVVVTAVSDYKQSLQFQSLNEEKQNIKIEVVRGGRRVSISIYDIVVGDVVPLKIGDQVPADGILISSHSLAIDESSMTGESKIVHKDHHDPFLMSGCKIADGYGTMLVTAVGINTEWGLLMASISEENIEETPLQVRLNGLTTLIGYVGMFIAASVFVVLMVRYFTGAIKNADGSAQFKRGVTTTKQAINGVIKLLTIAVTIIVVAVPEGLPLAVTLTLAFSMRKMMKDKALVRRLSACETMGSATTVCSDKTGTLTLNEMTVVETRFSGGQNDLSASASAILIEGIAQNTTGSVYQTEDGAFEVTGSPTEKAIINWGIKLGMNFSEIRSKSSLLQAFPFNSEKKRGGVAVHVGGSDVHIHWKGAAEIVLESCRSWLDKDGLQQPITSEKVQEYKECIKQMAAASLRCIAFAYRPFEMKEVPKEEERADWILPEDDLVLLGIVGIKDPCRPGVKDAVNVCTLAGVKVRMVTGDNIQTAKAIAMECGILADANVSAPTIIEGPAFRALTESERVAIAEQISVMGRSSPNDKLLLVKALRQNGHVVGVTGDGTNDAPALHEADIGLAMGIQGTEVAKESADIIILDDNFETVVRVIRWGRSVYANIQKFIQFQLTVNVAALAINFVAAITSGTVPLSAVQLLWVNLIMDTLGALALATEPPTDHLMKMPPVGRSEPLVTNIMWRNLFIQAAFQISVLLVLTFKGIDILKLTHDDPVHAEKLKNTFIFNTFVLCQMFNEFNSRMPDQFNIFSGLSKNYLFVGIVAVTAVLQVVIVEFLGKFASTVRLSWQLWLVSVAIAFVSWPLALVGKFIPVPEKPLGEYIPLHKVCFWKKQNKLEAAKDDTNLDA